MPDRNQLRCGELKIAIKSSNLTNITHFQVETTGIRWPDGRASGVSLRSARMKLPGGVGLKKTKAIENMCQVCGDILYFDDPYLHPPNI